MWLTQRCGGSRELVHQRRGEGAQTACARRESSELHVRMIQSGMSERESLSTKDGIDNEESTARGRCFLDRALPKLRRDMLYISRKNLNWGLLCDSQNVHTLCGCSSAHSEIVGGIVGQ